MTFQNNHLVMGLSILEFKVDFLKNLREQIFLLVPSLSIRYVIGNVFTRRLSFLSCASSFMLNNMYIYRLTLLNIIECIVTERSVNVVPFYSSYNT